jgi:hypothetical protein
MGSITISNILTILQSRRLRLQVDGYGYEVEKWMAMVVAAGLLLLGVMW